METPSDCVYYPLYYYLHNSVQKHQNSRLVWPKPQNRKSSQRTAHYNYGRGLSSPFPSFPACSLFLSPQPPHNTKRPLQRREFYRSHPLSSLRKADIFPVTASLPLLFFKGRALFFSRVFNIIQHIRPPITPIKARESSE